MKIDMNTLASSNEEHESWSCYFWNENEYLMNFCNGAHRFSYAFLSMLYILDLNMYLGARNYLRSQAALGLHTVANNCPNWG